MTLDGDAYATSCGAVQDQGSLLFLANLGDAVDATIATDDWVNVGVHSGHGMALPLLPSRQIHVRAALPAKGTDVWAWLSTTVAS